MPFHGLFIGVDRYASPNINWLTCARRDAQALNCLFSDTLEGTTTLLVDEEASRRSIIEQLELLKKCNPDDTVVITFSGHGSETHELVTYDADPSQLADTAISLDELTNHFSEIPVKHLVLILDCCFSGGAGARVLKVDAVSRSIASVETKLSEMSGTGRIIFTACGPNEEAWESQKRGHGFFTSVLLEALQGPSEIVSGGRIPVYPLLEFVTNRVRSQAEYISRSQNPTLRGTIDGTLDWPIFAPGPTYLEAFPDYSEAKATEKISSLSEFGFPDALLEVWSSAIPSLNQLQIDAVNDFGVLRGEHLVVSAPTSSGKTMIGELASLKTVLDRKRAIFLMPLKALVADKARYFESVYSSFGIKTIEATGETDDISDLLRGQYDIALLTYEKFSGIVLTHPHVLDQVGVVVVDETQMLADQSRGANLEFLITLIRMRRKEGIKPQLISLSAVIGDTNGFENWIGARLLKREERPVPLDEGLLLGDGRFRFLDGETFEEKVAGPIVTPAYSGKNSSQDLIIPLIEKLTGEGKQVIVFRETKGETIGCANYLAKALPETPASDALARLPGGDPSVGSGTLRDTLQRGVCFHNADLSPEERRVIEEEFREQPSQIKVIAATTTLAMGVNTPAAAVVVAGLMHPGGEPYSVAEYKNLVGRAGRLGFIDRGTSYLIAQSPASEHDYWHNFVTAEPEDLYSRFLDDETDVRSLIVRVLVNIQRLSEGGISAETIAEFLEGSFGAYQAVKNSSGGWQWNRDEILRGLTSLHQNELVSKTDQEQYELTSLGRLAGETATEVVSIIRLVETLKSLRAEEITDPALIAAVQQTKEVDEVLFPINKRSTQKEPDAWFGELQHQGVSGHILNQLHRHTEERHQPALRAKKAVACLFFVAGTEMSEMERTFTQFGGGSRSAAGPIRSAAARTCDLLPVAAQVAELLHAEVNFEDRIGRLAIRLTYGVQSGLAELARLTGAQLTRGDYNRLAQNVGDLSAIENASDTDILDCIDDSAEKLALIRDAISKEKELRDGRTAGVVSLTPYEP